MIFPRGDDSIPARDGNGFTLLEMMVAITIAGIVALFARAVLEQVTDATDRLVVATSAANVEANVMRWLRAILLQAEQGDALTPGFVGSPDFVRFASWCDSPAGWQEPCDVVLDLADGPGGKSLTVSTSDGERVVIQGGVTSGHFLYLYSAGGSGTWLTNWTSTITIPVALGVVMGQDTLILRIGPRG